MRLILSILFWIKVAILCIVLAVVIGKLTLPCGAEKSPAHPAIHAKATAAVYVYEKSDGAVPDEVLTAFDKLNRAGVIATDFDVDTINGRKEVPAQYKAALEAAKESGLPTLVIMGRKIDQILRTVKDPKTEAAVLEAVK